MPRNARVRARPAAGHLARPSLAKRRSPARRPRESAVLTSTLRCQNFAVTRATRNGSTAGQPVQGAGERKRGPQLCLHPTRHATARSALLCSAPLLLHVIRDAGDVEQLDIKHHGAGGRHARPPCGCRHRSGGGSAEGWAGCARRAPRRTLPPLPLAALTAPSTAPSAHLRAGLWGRTGCPGCRAAARRPPSWSAGPRPGPAAPAEGRGWGGGHRRSALCTRPPAPPGAQPRLPCTPAASQAAPPPAPPPPAAAAADLSAPAPTGRRTWPAPRRIW